MNPAISDWWFFLTFSVEICTTAAEGWKSFQINFGKWCVQLVAAAWHAMILSLASQSYSTGDTALYAVNIFHVMVYNLILSIIDYKCTPSVSAVHVNFIISIFSIKTKVFQYLYHVLVVLTSGYINRSLLSL